MFAQVFAGTAMGPLPVAALILFVGVFVAILGRVWGDRARAELERAAHLPLDDDRNERRRAAR